MKSGIRGRGGAGRGQGRKQGITVGSYKPDEEKAQPVTFRLYETDLAGLRALVGKGYARDRTAALRRAIAEAVRLLG